MSFNTFVIIFLRLLYIGLAVCFHKNMQTGRNYLYVNKKLDLYNQNKFFDISLPYLHSQDKMILASGEIIQKQERNGYMGKGLVVIDIKSSPDLILDTLTRFSMYQDMIPIIRSSKIVSSDGVNVFTEFILSKFLLRVNIKQTVIKEQRIIHFSLDSTRVNFVFKEVQGFWHVQIPTDRPEGYCRVYLSTQILAQKMVPTVILDYAASRALQRATEWLKPFFEKDISNE